VERESFSWRYPSEIIELATFAPALETFESQVINFSVINASLKIADQTYVNDKDDSRQKAPIRHLNHIVTIEPKIDHIHIKTIKPTTQPNIVKVEIRGKEVMENESTLKNAGNTGTAPYTSHVAQELLSNAAASRPSRQPNMPYSSPSRLSQRGYSLFINNRMEMLVLLIGAASLLAVAYLFITTGY